LNGHPDATWDDVGLASCSGGRMHPDGVYLMDGFPYKEEDVSILWHHIRNIVVKPGLKITQPSNATVIDSHTLSFDFCASFALSITIISWGGVGELTLCGTQRLEFDAAGWLIKAEGNSISDDT